MFTHVMVGTDNIDASTKFYDATFAALAISPGKIDPFGRVFYRTETGAFGITKPIDGCAASPANGGTIGFPAASPEQVRAWHDAGLAAGGIACEEPPGERTPFGSYAAYLRDPAGNKLCVSCRV